MKHIKLKKKILDIFKKHGEDVFLINLKNNKEVSYSEVLNKVYCLIKHFKSINLEKNNKILIKTTNSENYLISLLASCLGGYAICPLDPDTKPERLEEIKKIINFDLFINEKFKFPNLKKKVILNNEDLMMDNHNFLIMSSSGTESSDFKGMLFSSNKFLNSAISFSKLSGYSAKTKLLHCLPMFYMAGILNTFFSCIFSKSTIVLSERYSILNSAKILNDSVNHKVNSLHLTPEIYLGIYKTYKRNKLKKLIKNINSLVSTGSMLHNEIKNNYLKSFNKKIFSCYGLTELGGPLTIQNTNNFKKNNCVGAHDKKIKIKIIKNRIFIDSPFVIKGFISRSGLSNIKLKNNFFDTGDLGFYKNKELFITGRDKDIIKKGGEIVSLTYIENVILSRDDIIEVAAVGLKDGKLLEENLFLFVTINGEYNIEEKHLEISNFCKSKLKRIEQPKKFLLSEKCLRPEIVK